MGIRRRLRKTEHDISAVEIDTYSPTTSAPPSNYVTATIRLGQPSPATFRNANKWLEPVPSPLLLDHVLDLFRIVALEARLSPVQLFHKLISEQTASDDLVWFPPVFTPCDTYGMRLMLRYLSQKYSFVFGWHSVALTE